MSKKRNEGDLGDYLNRKERPNWPKIQARLEAMKANPPASQRSLESVSSTEIAPKIPKKVAPGKSRAMHGDMEREDAERAYGPHYARKHFGGRE